MGSAFMLGIELVKIAEAHGWTDRGPGAAHPHVMVNLGARNVPIRAKLQNKYECQDILKQLGIPRAAWPTKLK